MVKYIQELENELKMKNKQIERLEYMIKFFSIGQQKRDIMVQLIQEENRKLKENYHNLEQELHREQSQKNLRDSLVKQTNQPQQPSSIQQTSPIQKGLLLRTRTREIQDDIAQGLLSLSIESLLQIQQRYQQIPHIDPLNAILANSYDRFEKNIQIMNTA